MRLFLLEDNKADMRLLTEAFKEIGQEIELTHALSFEEGRQFVEHCLADHKVPVPDVMVLDIRLPVDSGLDLLRLVRSHSLFNNVPVLMLTTSEHPQDVEEARAAHATSYYVKPKDLDAFVDLARELVAFWLERAK